METDAYGTFLAKAWFFREPWRSGLRFGDLEIGYGTHGAKDVDLI